MGIESTTVALQSHPCDSTSQCLKISIYKIINKIYHIFSGTRIGQASECFVYWKDPMTNDTWGLNFTSPIDAKQFRECCVSDIVII